ncbi:NADP-dependent oxidoreductase [Mucilaginibacter lutimaris]|uniref:NADP-dependent oxidoreductase n=1 Tax=Mucilaginibacter lutimaris TaxID=931629 RepID=A0ABW2ZE06_9SPHI
MKAVVYHQFGNTNVLQMVEQPKPGIRPDQILIQVKAFSINPMDWKIRKGEMTLMSGSKFPKRTGTDLSGIIAGIGAEVRGLKVGDEVFGVVQNIMKEGVSAEYITLPASLVWKKPKNLSFAQAAAIPVAGTAAVTALEKMGNIGTQTKILINGATGSFGMFLLQLLRPKGADVTAVTGSKGTTYAKDWGAATVIDYTAENVLTSKETYDIVIDLSGKMGYQKAKPIMNPKAVFLNATPKPIEIPGSLLNNLFTGKKHQVILSAPSTKYTNMLLDAINSGLEIEIHKVFPFSEYQQAYEYAERGGYVGKIVVEIA